MEFSLTLVGWLGAVFGFGLLILVHEFGHFWALKKKGFKVFAFSIGFGTPVWKRNLNQTEYRLGWIPFGGYVLPENPDQIEFSGDSEQGFFPGVSPSAQIFVAIMGPVFNLILAFLFFWLILWAWGDPIPVPVVDSVVKGSPSESIGLLPLDRIIRFNNVKIESWTSMLEEIKKNGESLTVIEIERNKKKEIFQISAKHEKDRFVLGIKPKIEPQKPLGLVESFFKGISKTWMETWNVCSGIIFYLFFSGTGELSGPIAILDQVSRTFSCGFFSFFNFLAFLSINLAVFNLLPIPPLDGLRIIISVCTVFRGKPIKEKTLVPIYQWGTVGLVLIFVIVTLKDLGEIFL